MARSSDVAMRWARELAQLGTTYSASATWSSGVNGDDLKRLCKNAVAVTLGFLLALGVILRLSLWALVAMAVLVQC